LAGPVGFVGGLPEPTTYGSEGRRSNLTELRAPPLLCPLL